jgi:hypothetical protein
MFDYYCEDDMIIQFFKMPTIFNLWYQYFKVASFLLFSFVLVSACGQESNNGSEIKATVTLQSQIDRAIRTWMSVTANPRGFKTVRGIVHSSKVQLCRARGKPDNCTTNAFATVDV